MLVDIQNFSEELRIIEKQLVFLVSRRTKILSEIAEMRKSNQLRAVSQTHEKELWEHWQHLLQHDRLDPKILHQLFLHLNTLGYLLSDKDESNKEYRPFCLFPHKSPANIDIDGPRHLRSTQMLIFLGAKSISPNKIQPFVTNDTYTFLGRALRKYGSTITFSWGECLLQPSKQKAPERNESIFVGDNTFNLYLLLCNQLNFTGTVKFHGGMLLRTEDCGCIPEILNIMGARFTRIEPHSMLPASLETTGQIPKTIELPDETPELFITALLLAAASFTKPTTFILKNIENLELCKIALNMLALSNIKTNIHKNQITVNPGEINLPNINDVSLDPIFSPYLLIQPYFCNGQVTLRGKWDETFNDNKIVLQILEEIGLSIEIYPDYIKSTVNILKDSVEIDLRSHCELLPLVLPIALRTSIKTTLYIDVNHKDTKISIEVLDILGTNYTLKDDIMTIEPSLKTIEERQPTTLVARSVQWTLSATLLAYGAPGICLQNPNNIMPAWPIFWKIFRHLPSPQDVLNKKEIEEEVADIKQKRRRVLVF